jgi:hypothetical protein
MAMAEAVTVSEAELTKASVLAREGEVDAATSAAEAGLAGERQSLPSLLMVGNEVAQELIRLHPRNESAREFSHHIRRLAHPNGNGHAG